MATYRNLRAAGVTTRAAAALTGLSRATAGRKPATPLRATRVVPANRLSVAERKRVVATLDSARFVDQPPLQVYAQLLDEDTYLCSVSSMYRILGEHHQVRERRRLARHPARVRPELVATGPGAGLQLGYHQARRPGQGQVLRRLRDDRHLLSLHRRSRSSCPRVGSVGGGDDEGDLRHPWGPRRAELAQQPVLMAPLRPLRKTQTATGASYPQAERQPVMSESPSRRICDHRRRILLRRSAARMSRESPTASAGRS